MLPQGMFLLLVTNRSSNILEDLDTLRLLSKLVPEYAGSMLDEDAVSRAAFDLIFAFDEVIALGHKEAVTLTQVKQNCEMESHEEKLHKMIIQSKINDTKARGSEGQGERTAAAALASSSRCMHACAQQMRACMQALPDSRRAARPPRPGRDEAQGDGD